MSADDFQIDTGECGRHAQLLEALVQYEDREAGSEWDFSRRSEAGADGDHVRLRDAALKETVRKLLGEGRRVRGLREIGVERDDVWVGPAEFNQGLAEGLARGSAGL